MDTTTPGQTPPATPEQTPPAHAALHIDCDTCVVRGLACHDCVVTVLLGPPEELSFDDDATRALDVLAAGGLVPPLRMVHPVASPQVETA
ncbi:MAG: hypothetical protein V9G04_05415 [Nocardioides sp.]